MLAQDGKAASVEQVLTMPLRGASWAIRAVDGDTGEAEAVNDWLTRPANAGGMSTPLPLVLGQMTAAITYRRAYFEKVWTVNAGDQIVYGALAWRPPASCVLLRKPDSGTFDGFQQYVGWSGGRRPGVDERGYVKIEPGRAFVYINQQHRNPTDGKSDLDVCYHAWSTKQKIRFLWNQFLENQSIPKTVPVLSFGQLAAEDAEKTGALLQAIIATPTGQQRMPAEFIDELMLRVASYLALDTDKVAKAIADLQAQAPPTPLGQTAAAVSAATNLVKAATPAAPSAA